MTAQTIADDIRRYNEQQRDAARRYNEQQADATRRYNEQQRDATRRYNEQQAQARERYNAQTRQSAHQSHAQRPAATASTVPACWAETLILQTGYRAAAMANHPDRGGDHNKMVAINEAHSAMKAQGRI